MKKLIKIAFAALLALGLSTTAIKAEETYIKVTSYTETFVPVGEDAELTTTVVATAGSDGYIYLIKNYADNKNTEDFKEDTIIKSVTGENIVPELEEYGQGAVKYYRAKVVDPTAEATITVVATCTGFYRENLVADTNGGQTNSLSYTFKNYFSDAIGKYSLTIYTPEGNDIVKVNTPAKYASFKLGEKDGLLSVGVSGKVAVNGSSAIAYTYNPAATTTSKLIVWAVCLGIGAFVFIDRYKKAK